MDIERLTQKRYALRERVSVLYRSAAEPAQHAELLSKAFEELQLAMEELQAAEEELREKNEMLATAIDTVEAERRRYEELFEFAPEPYLVTGLDGTIRQANQAARALLHAEPKFLVGRSLALFVPEGERRTFRATLAEQRQADQVRDWEVRMQAWNGTVFDAAVTTVLVRDGARRPVARRWLIRDISERKRAEELLRARVAELERRIAEQPGQDGAARPVAGDGADGSVAHPAYTEISPTTQAMYTFLAEASVMLAVAPDPEAALGQVAHLAVPAFADLCTVDVVERGALRCLAVAHADQQHADLVRELQQRYPPSGEAGRGVGEVLRGGKPLLYGDIPACQLDGHAHNDDQLGLLRSLAPASVLIVPLRSHDRVLGALTFVSCDLRRRYGPGDLALAEEISRRAVAALEKARQYHQE